MSVNHASNRFGESLSETPASPFTTPAPIDDDTFERAAIDGPFAVASAAPIAHATVDDTFELAANDDPFSEGLGLDPGLPFANDYAPTGDYGHRRSRDRSTHRLRLRRHRARPHRTDVLADDTTIFGAADLLDPFGATHDDATANVEAPSVASEILSGKPHRQPDDPAALIHAA